jgi:acetyltransferase-like isoleucine patch superfamily enzyme
MEKIKYFWSKILKKLRFSAVKNSRIHKLSSVQSGSEILNVKMDKYSYCGYNCSINNATIGSYTSIANNVIIGGPMHETSWVSTSPVFYKSKGRNSIREKFSLHQRSIIKKTLIGNDVWIGHSAIVKQGVSIGNGAVIGMGSIVTKDVPDYAIFAGNPAKLIKFRFDENIIKKLLKIQWWNLKEREIQKFSKYIINPEDFIDRIDR